MKTKDILQELANGATLCMGYGETGSTYWLEPKRLTVSTSQATQIIPLLKPGGDHLRITEDLVSQTWKAK